jgi:hypothetical protein
VVSSPVAFFYLVVVVVQDRTPCNTLGGWLSHAVARNGISIHRTAKLAGIHHNTLHACIKGETNMRLFNLIAVIGVLAKVEDRSPVELMQEAVMSMEDLQLMEQRFQKRKDDSK